MRTETFGAIAEGKTSRLAAASTRSTHGLPIASVTPPPSTTVRMDIMVTQLAMAVPRRSAAESTTRRTSSSPEW